MNKPGQITAMISSTVLDLPEHRKQVLEACLSEGVFPIGMEHLPARDATGIQTSMELLCNADIYLGIYAWRYGWVPDFDNPDNISITEMEFNKALECKRNGELKEILIFVMHDEHPTKRADVEADIIAQEKLRKLKERASSGRVQLIFKSKEELRGQVIQSLADFKRRFFDGDRHGDEGSPSADPIPKPPAFYAEPHYIVSQAFVGREPQLEVLSKWAMASDPHSVLLFEAIGGNGKSMLTWEWTTKYSTKVRTDWAGRFWYSFYEKGAVMTDFCQRALAYISGRPLKNFQGIKTPELAERLLYYLQERPWLFVLDGLERVLVAYHRIDAAEVPDEEVNIPTDKIVNRDPCSAIRPEDDDLLRAFASAAPSKLLMSSRLVPRALLNRANKAIPSVLPINLPGLLPSDAERLIRSFDISGDSHAIQNYLETHCACHPLVIGVLAGLINDYLPERGNFDAWAADRSGGNQLNLANLDLVQKRNHILTAGLNALPEKSHQLLSTLALLSEAVDYSTLCAFNPHMPPEPVEVKEPTNLENDWRWDRLSETERAEARKSYEIAINKRKEYEHSVKSYLDSSEVLAATQELEKTVSDLVRRGLLQYDGRIKRYDLHPVVRGVAAGGLRAEEKDLYGQRVVDHFSHQVHDSYEQTENIEDLRCSLEVVRTLLKMGHFQKACNAYIGELASALLFNLEAYSEVLSLLRPFFPQGWASRPNIEDKYDAATLANLAAFALDATKEPKEAIATYNVALLIYLDIKNWVSVRIVIHGISLTLAAQNRLAKQEYCLLITLNIAALTDNKQELFKARLTRFRQLVDIGQWAEAEAIWQLLDPMGRSWARNIYRPGEAERSYALFRYWKGDLKEEHLVKAEQFAKEGKNRLGIRFLHALRGQWYLDQDQWELAAGSFHEAVRLSREVGQTDSDVETKLALVKFHLNQLPDPCEEAEQLAQARKPSYRALADLWLAIGDLEQAKKYAILAYRWAWADGEPYVHRYELKKATAILKQLNLPIPDLLSYDWAKDEKLPWEDTVANAIEKLKAEKEAKMTKTYDPDVAEADDSDNDRFSFGKVVRTTDSGLILQEYDFGADADKEVFYLVTSETEYGNIENITNLLNGDDVVVDYRVSQGKRVITTLVKEDKEQQI